MRIRLPGDLTGSIRSLVGGGRFASVGEAMAEAARLLLKQSPPARKAMTEQELHRPMLELGPMTHLPDHPADHDDPDDRPIEILGEPLPETVIRGRR